MTACAERGGRTGEDRCSPPQGGCFVQSEGVDGWYLEAMSALYLVTKLVLTAVEPLVGDMPLFSLCHPLARPSASTVCSGVCRDAGLAVGRTCIGPRTHGGLETWEARLPSPWLASQLRQASVPCRTSLDIPTCPPYGHPQTPVLGRCGHHVVRRAQGGTLFMLKHSCENALVVYCPVDPSVLLAGCARVYWAAWRAARRSCISSSIRAVPSSWYPAALNWTSNSCELASWASVAVRPSWSCGSIFSTIWSRSSCVCASAAMPSKTAAARAVRGGGWSSSSYRDSLTLSRRRAMVSRCARSGQPLLGYMPPRADLQGSCP